MSRMKCKSCHETIRCACCGTRAISPQHRFTRKQLKAGKCPQCGTHKTGDDLKRHFCRTCRIKVAARARAVYAAKKLGRVA